MRMQSRRVIARPSPRVHDESEPRPPTLRSAVSNGSRLHAEADGRSTWSRRFRDLILAHTADLGGRANMSEAQLALVRRASALEVALEEMEGLMSEGHAVDLDKFGRAAGNLGRILQALGLRREARDITAETDQAKLDRLLAYAAEEPRP
jgi:hypothetical protein